MLSTSLNSQTPTVRSKIASLSDVIDQLSDTIFNVGCPINYPINSQIPSWILFEKQDRETEGISNQLTIYDFIQKYYDWLYCDSSVGSQYQLSQKFLDLIDIDRTRSSFLQRIAMIYADGFDPKVLEENGGLVTEENLRLFLKNIRTAVYHKKTTEDGIRYFFTRLFGLNEDSINIEIPKKFVLRLNGGRFSDTNFTFPGGTGTYEDLGTLSGSYLNGSRLQDSNWFQDWSYLLKVGVISTQYKDTYTDILHPAGIKVVFEKTLADYQGPESDETIPFVCEYPMLKNYAPYGISFDYTGVSAGIYISGSWPVGITFVGVTANTGCCGASFAGFTGPTYVFPSWTSQTDVFNFKDIYISTMFELCYSLETGSPNDGSACT